MGKRDMGCTAYCSARICPWGGLSRIFPRFLDGRQCIGVGLCRQLLVARYVLLPTSKGARDLKVGWSSGMLLLLLCQQALY